MAELTQDSDIALAHEIVASAGSKAHGAYIVHLTDYNLWATYEVGPYGVHNGEGFESQEEARGHFKTVCDEMGIKEA